MLDRIELEPLFFAPFVSSVMRVEPGWIDYNGHLNMAYYNVLFDRAVDEAYELIGVGLDYLKRHKHSTFTAEVHVRYLRELKESDPVRVTFQLLGYDQKRLHLFLTMHLGDLPEAVATTEQMQANYDMKAGRTAPFLPEVMAKIEAIARRQGGLPRPAYVGRVIALPPKKA